MLTLDFFSTGQKQKRRLQELEQRLTGFHVESSQYGNGPALPEVDIEAMRNCGAFDTPSNTWSELAISYPIAAIVNTRMGCIPLQGPRTAAVPTATPSTSQPNPPSRYAPQPRPRAQSQSQYAAGYIQPFAEDIQENMTPYLTISIVPVRNAVKTNLVVLGIDEGQYQSDNALSPFRNGGFACSMNLQQVLSGVAKHAPNLLPTQLQLEVDHHPYIDIIPSASIRDRLLGALFSESFPSDQEELCRDIEWGLVVWGKASWDERSWEWTADFVEKWCWLFDQETLESTNFWKTQRGESPIDLDGLHCSSSSSSHKGKQPEYH
jgi:hypothetical protein